MVVPASKLKRLLYWPRWSQASALTICIIQQGSHGVDMQRLLRGENSILSSVNFCTTKHLGLFNIRRTGMPHMIHAQRRCLILFDIGNMSRTDRFAANMRAVKARPSLGDSTIVLIDSTSRPSLHFAVHTGSDLSSQALSRKSFPRDRGHLFKHICKMDMISLVIIRFRKPFYQLRSLPRLACRHTPARAMQRVCSPLHGTAPDLGQMCHIMSKGCTEACQLVKPQDAWPWSSVWTSKFAESQPILHTAEPRAQSHVRTIQCWPSWHMNVATFQGCMCTTAYRHHGPW